MMGLDQAKAGYTTICLFQWSRLLNSVRVVVEIIKSPRRSGCKILRGMPQDTGTCIAPNIMADEVFKQVQGLFEGQIVRSKLYARFVDPRVYVECRTSKARRRPS